ncbi:MAG: 3'-5' exoribonuclease [Candidatus Pacebacteria bacterium]|nr:3'-5' exoribonuclease [Candidatus Paceibacterota bacterium]
MINSYSKNIIFFDTEFSSLDIKKGEILSLGFIKLNGEELYLELDFDGDVDEWPKNNILPNLTQNKINKEEAIRKIINFIGNDNPYVVAYINQFDMAYFYKLFGLDNFNDKFNWIPIDFASILFSLNINPEILAERENSFFDKLGIDLSKYIQHNALEDAKLLREVYLKTSNL